MELLETINTFNAQRCREWERIGLDPNDAGTVETNLNIWAGREVVTSAQFNEYMDLHDSYSDYFKDVHGFRPRYNWPETLSEFREANDSLRREVNAIIAERESILRAEKYEKELRRRDFQIRKQRSENFGSMMFVDKLYDALVSAAK